MEDCEGGQCRPIRNATKRGKENTEVFGQWQHDNACCDSGAGGTDNTRYKPNESRQRRPRARGAMTLQSHVGSTEPIRKQNDWVEIWGLGHALAFETLRTTLLILLVVVRLGAAWARHFEKWLDAEELQNRVGQSHKSRAGDSTTDPTSNSRTDGIESCRPATTSTDRTDRELGFSDNISDDFSGFSDNSTDFTGPANKSTGPTDCAKPTDVRKRHIVKGIHVCTHVMPVCLIAIG
jgi:hypothetical protein